MQPIHNAPRARPGWDQQGITSFGAQLQRSYLFEVQANPQLLQRVETAFQSCFNQFVAYLENHFPERTQTSSQLRIVAWEHAEVLRGFLFSQNWGGVGERGEQPIPMEDDELSLEETALQRLQRQARFLGNKQRKLREEIADLRDALKEHDAYDIEAGEDLPEARGAGAPAARQGPRREREYDPENPAHVQNRINSRRKHIKRRKKEKEGLERELILRQEELPAEQVYPDALFIPENYDPVAIAARIREAVASGQSEEVSAIFSEVPEEFQKQFAFDQFAIQRFSEDSMVLDCQNVDLETAVQRFAEAKSLLPNDVKLCTFCMNRQAAQSLSEEIDRKELVPEGFQLRLGNLSARYLWLEPA